MEAWIKTTNCGHRAIMGWGSSGKDRAQVLRFDGCSRLHHYWWANDLNADAGKNLGDGMWHHVASTFDGSTRRIYVDFVQVGSKSGARPGGKFTDKSTFCVDKFESADPYHNRQFNGELAGVRVHDWPIVPSIAANPTPIG